MCTVRYIGRFLPDDPLAVPWPVVEHLAEQLGIEDPSCVKRYTGRPKTAYEHAWEIRDAYEYHEYDDAEWGRKFRTFLQGGRGRTPRGRWRCSTRRWAGCAATGCCCLVFRCWPGRSPRSAESRRGGCTPPLPGPRPAWTGSCPRSWWMQPNGRAKLNVDALGALGEPKSLRWLRRRVERMLPKVDLPDLLFEVHGWTGFLDTFVHLGDGTTRMKDLHTSVVALLVSEACNIGLTPVVNPAIEALTRSRLVHVDQYYLRSDTIAAANAALIAAQAKVPIVRYWGDGLLASVDGLRFVVPVRTINAAPSPKYFGFKRGITWLNAVSDQVAGIGQMVVPGTPRDSLHILDALLNLDGAVKPEMVATDNASYSDMVFGLFKILGYNFSPRFRDLDDQRFWRASLPGVEAGTYGPLEDIARNRVNLN